MKKVSAAFAGLFFLLLSLRVNAQTKTGADYFAGKWNLLVKRLPTGDKKVFVVLEKKDSTMTGAIQDSTGNETEKVSKVEATEKEATVYFTAQGYDGFAYT